MDTPKKGNLSRFLTYILRHNPQEIGIQLGKDGFVEISVLLEAMHKKNRYTDADENTIREAVRAQTVKQRLEINGTKIRACYGHSARVIEKIDYPVVEPPAYLYHGTATYNLDSIRKYGLLPCERRYVHISESIARAKDVASRHSNKISIIKVLCEKARKAGIEFYHPEPEIWLVEKMPPEFLEIPQ